MSSENKITYINDLEEYMQSWTIKVIVVRVGIPYEVAQSKKMQKIIFADEKGTCIFGTLYEKAVDDLAGIFFKTKAYTISKGRIQKVNTKYDYVNARIQLWLDNRTSITEIDEGFKVNMDYNFKSFEEITKKPEEQIDILGFVAKVKQCFTTNTKAGKLCHKREILIVNEELQIMKLVLWGDYATSEGDSLEKMEDKIMTIAVSKINVKEFKGETQLQTTGASIIEINPTINEAENMLKWYNTLEEGANLEYLAMTKLLSMTKEIQLHEVVDENSTLKDFNYYCFRAKIKVINNQSKPYYDSCKRCTKAIMGTSDKVECLNCKNINLVDTPRFRLDLDVVSESQTINVVLFGDVAAAVVGCSVQKYINSLEEDPFNSPYYDNLLSSIWREYKFLFKLDKSKITGNKKSIVIEALTPIKIINDEEDNEENKEVVQKDEVTETIGEISVTEKIATTTIEEGEWNSNTEKAKKKRGRPKKTKSQATAKPIHIDDNADDDDQTLLSFYKNRKIKKEKI